MARGEPEFRQGVPARRKFASLRVRRPVPTRGVDTPEDEELLRYLEDALEPSERAPVERRIVRSRYALDRLFIVRQALADCA
ncbi:MAG TPA: hypothetical protein VKN99_18720 [Polyangia bacterium]|nr:hypothetical protein [Polyangia bacterium]